MSPFNKTFLFFLKCPCLTNLVSFSVDVPSENQGNGLSLFHRRILKCRQLIFFEADIVATPNQFSKSLITATIPKVKFYSTEFKRKLEMMALTLVEVFDTSPNVLQECLQYTVLARLAPQWNNVQNLLVQGRDFLIATGPLKAIKLDVFVNDNEITLCVTPTCIILPHLKIEKFVNMNEMSRTSFNINEKCHVLPSLKVGKATSLSKSMLSTSMFKSYLDLKKHWKNMYGYRLPDIPEENIWYVNIEFNVPNSTPLTYPYFCVRPFGMTEVPRVDPQLALQSFIFDFCKKMNNICKEKCQILDLKASFPLLQLYPAASAIRDTAPRIGTTYSMVKNVPFRNYSIAPMSNADQNLKMKNENQTEVKSAQNYTKSFKNDLGLFRENAFMKKTNKLHENPLSFTNQNKTVEKQHLVKESRIANQSLENNTCQIKDGRINFQYRNNVSSTDLLLSKKMKSGDSNLASNNNFKLNRSPMSNGDTNISQTKSESNQPPKYKPNFHPKVSKLPMKTLPEIFSIVKSPKYPNKVPLVNAHLNTKQKSLTSNFASRQNIFGCPSEINVSTITKNVKISKENLINFSDEINKSSRNFEQKSHIRKRKGNEDTFVEKSNKKNRKCNSSTTKTNKKKSAKC